MACMGPGKREECVIPWRCVELYIRRLKVYIYSIEERQIQAAAGDEIDVIEGASILKAKKKKVAELIEQIFT